MVYFVRTPEGWIKIGTTCDPEARMCNHRPGLGRSLKFMAAIPGWESEERMIHRHFADIRIPRGRELFKSMPRLLEFIVNLPEPVARDFYEAKEKSSYLNYGPGGYWDQWLLRDARRKPSIEIRRNRLIYLSPIAEPHAVGAG